MYVYLLKCSDSSVYVGVTNNLKRRMKEHKAGYDKNAYTYSRRPANLWWHEKLPIPADDRNTMKIISGWSQYRKSLLIREEFGFFVLNTGYIKGNPYENKLKKKKENI